MRTKYLIGLAALIMTFAVYVFYHPPGTGTAKEKALCPDYSSGTINTISAELVEEMKKGYKDHQLKHINNNMRSLIQGEDGDAQAILFKLGPLKEFIYHIETLAHVQGVKSEDLGIRLYYAMYPDNETWSTDYPDLSLFLGHPLTKQYEFRHTIVAIPTREIGGIDKDYNPLEPLINTASMTGPLNYRSNSIFNFQSETPALTPMALPEGGRAAQNHGNLYPPFGS